MDPSEQFGGRPSPRRELQLHGPRPTPLRVSKDSHKINKKPPLAPPPHAAAGPPPQHRLPVIIYTVSPKVIHINPNEFMSLVQRLTGRSTSATAATNTNHPVAAISPAARLAVIEKAASASTAVKLEDSMDVMNHLGSDDGLHCNFDRAAASYYPAGILSPVPTALPPVSANFFSPLKDTGSLSYLHELSPAFHGSRGFMDSSSFFTNSPGNLLSTPAIPSPNAYWDLFNQLKDF